MKIQMTDDGTRFVGAPVDIVRKLRARDHGKTRDVDAFMRRVADELRFGIDGETLEQRCDAFLIGLIKSGPATPEFHASHVDAHAVRILRKVHGLSRDKLAQTLGVAPMTVNRWESGEHAVSADRLNSIKQMLFDTVSSQPEWSAEPALATATHACEGSLLWNRQRIRAQMRDIQHVPTWARSA